MLKVWRLFLALLALMIRCIGRGRRRDEWVVAADTPRLLEWADGPPARGAEEGDWVGAERLATGEAFHWQDKPKELTTSSDQPILCVFT